MKNSIYTKAIDGIRAPESAVERAVREAVNKAEEPPSHNSRARIIAAAACFVLVSAAAVIMFFVFGNRPPLETKPSPIAVAESAGVSEKPQGTIVSSEKPAKTATAPTSAGTERSTVIASSETDDVSEQSETESAAEKPVQTQTQTATQAATEKSAQPTAATQAPTEGDTDIIDIDFSKVCDDGEVYCTLAETGLFRIEDPDAFTDDHLIYVKTKWETKVMKNPKYLLEELLAKDTGGDKTYYYYNSDGDILYEEDVD